MNWDNLTPMDVGDLPINVQENYEKHAVRLPCDISPYQINRFQVGTGASGVTETSAVYALGAPLEDGKYGGSARSVDVENALLYLREDTPLEEQAFVKLERQGQLGTSSLVSVVFLDEQTANGIKIDEVGLFVDNPFLYFKYGSTLGVAPANFSQLGGGATASGAVGTPDPERPGHLLAAYRQITPVQKESYFSLMIRWTINFSVDRDL